MSYKTTIRLVELALLAVGVALVNDVRLSLGITFISMFVVLKGMDQ